jgi:hypothetical protein
MQKLRLVAVLKQDKCQSCLSTPFFLREGRRFFGACRSQATKMDRFYCDFIERTDASGRPLPTWVITCLCDHVCLYSGPDLLDALNHFLHEHWRATDRGHVPPDKRYLLGTAKFAFDYCARCGEPLPGKLSRTCSVVDCCVPFHGLYAPPHQRLHCVLRWKELRQQAKLLQGTLVGGGPKKVLAKVTANGDLHGSSAPEGASPLRMHLCRVFCLRCPFNALLVACFVRCRCNQTA